MMTKAQACRSMLFIKRFMPLMRKSKRFATSELWIYDSKLGARSKHWYRNLIAPPEVGVKVIARAILRASTSCRLMLVVFLMASFLIARADERLIPAMFPEPQPFLEAIEKERVATPPALAITGISVPHHLLAADLIARGFVAASGNRYERVIVISPDHFSKSRRALATTRADIATAFGTLRNDEVVTAALLNDATLFDESDLFGSEHGVAALLPFVKHFFPEARIVPIVVSYGSTRADWDAAVAALAPFAGPDTLIVQSTDYSHYLPHEVAQQRDQETLNVIAAEDVDAVAGLVQPDHMDSKGSQYIQMRLQAGTRRARGTVIANRSSTEYSTLGTQTTSYVVTVYAQDPVAGSGLRYPDQDIVYFGGDVFIGRWLTEPMADPAGSRAAIDAILKVTHGAPLVVNLEGVLLDEPPPGLDPDLHAMHASLAGPILNALNVKVAGYANNHSHDLGMDGAKQSAAMLERAGILPLGHMEAGKLGRLGIIAVNFIGVHDYKGYPVIKNGAELERLCRMDLGAPLIALVHWGEEYTRDARAEELASADIMHGCGANIIVGAHSHQATEHILARQGGEYQVTYSLGNLLFDQRGERASSALLEVRMFRQGTVATRLVPLPNLFDLASSRASIQPQPSQTEPSQAPTDLRNTESRQCVGLGC